MLEQQDKIPSRNNSLPKTIGHRLKQNLQYYKKACTHLTLIYLKTTSIICQQQLKVTDVLIPQDFQNI